MPTCRRALGAALLLLGAVLSGGCKEERESMTGLQSQVVNGDDLFFSALISTLVYRFQNEVAEIALKQIEAGQTSTVDIASCVGGGRMIGRPVGPQEWHFVFDNFGIYCGSLVPLLVNSDQCETGGMFIRFEQVSPGLEYTVSMPLVTEILGEDAQGRQITRVVTNGVVYTLPSEISGAILAVTTPGRVLRDANGRLIEEVVNPDSDCELRYARTVDDFITCELEPGAGLRTGGIVHQTGTLRIEDRTQPLLIVQELQLEYTYDDQELIRFGPWPGGSYEIALFASLGLVGSVSSLPVDVTFDGAGGASFEHAGLQCDVNLLTGENPCSGL
jgi:hypothetical protein